MRKKDLTVLAIMLICVVLTGAASAESGYTSVSQIPMAVDFTFRVDFDDEGLPHIVTDYPFDAAGADEMNLIYNKGDRGEAFTLTYDHSTGKTGIRSWYSDLFPDGPEDAYRALRDGEVAADDSVYINTAHFSDATDWVLEYSVGGKEYTAYTERNRAQAFNAMGTGGTAKSILYSGGRISSASVLKRAENADLYIEFNPYGEMTDAYIAVYTPKRGDYYYDSSTGRFNGHTLTELGFEESDMETRPLAAMEVRTETGSDPEIPDAAVKPGSGPAFSLAGGLLTGIVIGIILYNTFIRKKKDNKKQTSADNVKAREPEPDSGSAEEPPPPLSRHL